MFVDVERFLALGTYFYGRFTCRGVTFSGSNYWESALSIARMGGAIRSQSVEVSVLPPPQGGVFRDLRGCRRRRRLPYKQREQTPTQWGNAM